MHRYLVAPLLAFGVSCYTQSLLAADDPRIASLREHAVALRTIAPDDEDFTDLQSLKSLLQDVRVVQLGEQTHGDGATFHAKTRLIRFLHREMGFDVIAFESGLYDCRKAWEQFAAGAEPREAAEQGIFGIWTQSEQFQPLLKYIADAAKTEHPLELCGFDCQFTAAASQNTLVSDVQAFLDHLPDQPIYRNNSAAVMEVLGKPKSLWIVPAPEEQVRILTAFQSLHEALGEPAIDAIHSADEIQFWRQFLQSTAAYVKIVWSRSANDPERTVADMVNPRDSQMADNLIWLARKRYPDRKIIVWAATMHIQRNPHLIDTRMPHFTYTGIETMGHHVAAALRDEVYTIGFTAFEGQSGLPWTEPSAIKPAPDDSLEELCVRAGLDNAFIDFRSPQTPEWLHQPLVSRPLGHSLMEADWTQVVDGMVFQRTMTPSTRSDGTADTAPQHEEPARPPNEQRANAGDLVGSIESDWKRAQGRLKNGTGYVDKVTFGGNYESWKEAADPSIEEITAMRKSVTQWFESQEPTPDLTWRVQAVLAMMLADEGDHAEAFRRFDAALAAYPKKTYRKPSSHSYFQHLVNEKAMVVWEEDGLDAALSFATETLASDSRFSYFYYFNWQRRLIAQNQADSWPTVREAILAAYEQRAVAFPDEAAAIRLYSSQLKEAAP